ncbi:MAG: glycosyltransferase [Eubacteriales bacterium]|nr:glycosyltransferase [Eubacteriales bacterium]
MKVLLINKFLYPRGGSESYCFALADLLKAMGHQVIWFSMKDERNIPCEQSAFFADNVDFSGNQSPIQKIKGASRLIYSKENKARISALIEQEHPDVAHLNLVHRHLTFSIVDALKEHHVPMVFTMHDLIALCPNYTMLSHGSICERCSSGGYRPCIQQKCVKDSTLKSLLAALEARHIRRGHGYDQINAFIAPSQFLCDKLTASHFSTSPVIRMTNFLPLGTRYERQSDASGGFLYFGRLSHEKGVRTLVRAFAHCEETLTLAGDGEEREWIAGFLRDNGMEGRVRLVGFQNKESMGALLSSARAVIVPSEWYENCPYTIMEAMSMGKPVLGSRIGGIPELVEDGKTGLLFEPFQEKSLLEALHRFAGLTDAEYAAMADASVAAAKSKFDAQAYGERLVRLYESVEQGRSL